MNIEGGGHRDPVQGDLQQRPQQMMLNGEIQASALSSQPFFWIRATVRKGRIVPASGSWGRAIKRHCEKEQVRAAAIAEPKAKADGYEPVTKAFGEGEAVELLETFTGFQGCRVVIVETGKGWEIWRHSSEVSRWSQKDEVNASTAIRLKGTKGER